MTADARTIPARGAVAALLILADRALAHHDITLGAEAQRMPLLARRDGLADAFRCIVAADFGVQYMVLDMHGLLDHAQQALADAAGL